MTRRSLSAPGLVRRRPNTKGACIRAGRLQAPSSLLPPQQNFKNKTSSPARPLHPPPPPALSTPPLVFCDDGSVGGGLLKSPHGIAQASSKDIKIPKRKPPDRSSRHD